MSNSSKKSAVIGLGNPLRKDDGIGLALMEALRQNNPVTGIDYLDFGVSSFDLLNRFRDYDNVILVDGIDAGLEPGELRIFKLKEIESLPIKNSSSTHDLDLKIISEILKNVDIKTNIYVAGIQIRDISFGEGITSEVKDKIIVNTPKIIDFIKKICF